jgi:hypothetical protein
MGFGTLVFAYFAMYAFSISPYYFFADIIGAVAAVFALSKLSEYSRYFVGAMFGALGFLVFSGVNAVSLLFALYPMKEGAVWLAVELLKLAAGAVMHVFLFLGIRVVAGRAEQEKLVKKSVRDLGASCLYFAAQAVVLPLEIILRENTAVAAASAGVWLFWVLCFVLNLSLIYGCFASIIPADADENEKPRSKIPFLNALSDKFDELDDKKNEYRRESMKLAMEEADRLRAEKQKKKAHKKKK